jgi:putative ABC transport system substrate-binding protein
MQFGQLKRREFITLFGGIAGAWPLAASAQHPPMPVIGYLGLASAAVMAPRVAGFKQGLSEVGYVEGQNVAIEYRYADNQFDRVSALAADLVRRKPALIYANGPPGVRAIRAHAASIPIVFQMGEYPVKKGSRREPQPSG